MIQVDSARTISNKLLYPTNSKCNQSSSTNRQPVTLWTAALLPQELDRLRQRTFPSFVQLHEDCGKVTRTMDMMDVDIILYTHLLF